MFKVKAVNTLQVLVDPDGAFHTGITKSYIQDANAEIGRQAQRIAELEALVPEREYNFRFTSPVMCGLTIKARSRNEAQEKFMQLRPDGTVLEVK